MYLGKCRLQYVHPFQKHILDSIASAYMSTKGETRGGKMGPIRGLELAMSSDTAGLGQNTMCICTCVCVCRFCAGGDE